MLKRNPAIQFAFAPSSRFPVRAGRPQAIVIDGFDPTNPGDGDVLAYSESAQSWLPTPASSGGVTDGDKGDITVASSGTVWTIDNGVVDIANLSATGTPSASTYLRGDNTWASVSSSGASYYEVRKSTLYGS